MKKLLSLIVSVSVLCTAFGAFAENTASSGNSSDNSEIQSFSGDSSSFTGVGSTIGAEDSSGGSNDNNGGNTTASQYDGTREQ